MDFIHQSCFYQMDLTDVDDEAFDELLDICFANEEDAISALRYSAWSLIALLLVSCYYLTWAYQSTWAANFHSLDGREFTYTISAQGFRSQEDGRSDHFYYWGGGVDRVVEHKDMLLFFIDQCVAHYIPLRAFTNPEQAAQFLAQAQTWQEEAACRAVKPKLGHTPTTRSDDT